MTTETKKFISTTGARGEVTENTYRGKQMLFRNSGVILPYNEKLVKEWVT